MKRNPNQQDEVDPFAQTRPTQTNQPYYNYEDYGEFEPIPLNPPRFRRPRPIWLLIFAILLFVAYFIFPSHKTILVLGIDRAFENTAIGRSDTNILLSVKTLPGEVKGLSIPRDLWVTIPNYGENRINAAHYFGEGESPGNGVVLAMDTLEYNFHYRPDYYLRIQLERFPAVIDAIGGIDITLTNPTAGYEPGTHHLNGEQALAFVRDRSGTDDFFRMVQGQIFITAFLNKLLSPSSWVHIPELLITAAQMVDTNIPLWQQPRLLVALLRATQNNFEFLSISREMVTPWVTDAGAQVLLPRWDLILPMFEEEFTP